MTAIDVIDRWIPRRLAALLAGLIVVCLTLAWASTALAGQSSTGELLFYPCTSCHPVTDAQLAAGRTFPNGFKGHDIVLHSHDVLGKGDAACFACHDTPDHNPGMLKAFGGTTVPVNGDVSLVCRTCHSDKYDEWKAGTHGKDLPSCTAQGCHDPHSPGFIYASSLMPFTGVGFQFQVKPVREPFTPLMAPAPVGIPPVLIPTWFIVTVIIGLFVVAVLIVLLVMERSRR